MTSFCNCFFFSYLGHQKSSYFQLQSRIFIHGQVRYHYMKCRYCRVKLVLNSKYSISGQKYIAIRDQLILPSCMASQSHFTFFLSSSQPKFING